MISGSVHIMTLIDALVISLTIFALWNMYRNRKILRRLKVFPGVALTIGGLIIISSFYIADIASMHILSRYSSADSARKFMINLHLNYNWFLSTTGIAIIVISLLYLNHIIFPKIDHMEKELQRRAATDSLTQAYNRLKFDEIIRREMARARRYDSMLSLAAFDLDHFKKINDTFGHLAGDEVLIKVVELTRQLIRESDFLARWGGEEFMIVLPETDIARAEETAQRIKSKIEKNDFNGISNITVSFGITQFRESDSEVEFLKRADDALYRAKAKGRNRVEVNA
jgi:diguanylate cyclase (GGDEF)-like protein